MGDAKGGMGNEKTGGLALSPVHSALRTRHSALRVVARGGSAPPISGCRPNVILFHHRAETGLPSRSPQGEGWLPGMERTTTPAFKGRCPANQTTRQKRLVARQGNAPCSIPIPNRDCITLMLAGQNGTRGRICTCTGDVLDVLSLLLDYAS